MSNPLPNERRGYSVAEVCGLYKVSAPTIYRWINEGLLDAFKIGHRRFISAEALDRMEKRARG